jgi:hypothetical protein
VECVSTATSELLEEALDDPDRGKPADVEITNQTNHRLVLTSRGGEVFVLAPLEKRDLRGAEAASYRLTEAADRSYIRVEHKPGSGQSQLAVLVGLGIWGVLGFVVYGLFAGTTRYWAIGAAAVVLVGTAAWCFSSPVRRAAFTRWRRRLPSRLAELAVLLLAVGAAVVAPAVTIAYGADLLAAWEDNFSDHVLGTGLQALLVIAFTGVPGLLYFAFDREQLQTLRSKFVLHVFRFDPSVETLADINARYGPLMDEAYGRETLTGRILPGKRLPVVIATAAMAVGWLLTLPMITYEDARSSSPEVLDYLRPREAALVFAFLGAYFFALNLVFRGYVRGDLRPKTYSQVTVRILLALVLAFVLGQWVDTDHALLLTVAFLGGVVPETILVRLREAVRGAGGRLGLGSGAADGLEALVERQPLTELEGIDIYDRARLEEEGVTNVEGLAHHDLVELMLRTRIPVSRLIDWVDQAILYLHLGGRGKEAQTARRTLRQHGIRTATDLLTAWNRAPSDPPNPLADLLPRTHEGAPSRVELIVAAMEDEEWTTTLLHWHERRGLETETKRFVRGRGLVDADPAGGLLEPARMSA